MKSINSAIEDFFAARRQAFLQEIIGRLTGKPTRLLAYDEVREQLRAGASEECGLRDIPLDAIIGSVGRYADFSRSFLPLSDKERQRWSRVDVAMSGMAGVPPIEVYQIGEVYFVKDGNHRVSVARHQGATHIQALVTEVQTRVPLSPDDRPDALILKGEYAAFLEQTHLDELRPGLELKLTVPGQYRALTDHIQVHHHFMRHEAQRDVSLAEAVADWYDTEYLPFAEIVRRRNLLRSFPGRTEADLYVWIAEHRASLQENLGWEVQFEAATADWAQRSKARLARVGERLRESPQAPGRWRREQLPPEQCGCLFTDILVPVSGDGQGWQAVDEALKFVSCAEARLLGLQVVASEAEARAEPAGAVRAEFERRCQAAGVPAEFAVEAAGTHSLRRRVQWADLVVMALPRPPEAGTLPGLPPALHDLLHHCPAPILAVPAPAVPLERLLLAYDGSATAKEALYVTAYLAAQWAAPAAVLTVEDDVAAATTVGEEACAYLEAHQASAALLLRSGTAADEILRTAAEQRASLIILGGEIPHLLPSPSAGRVVDTVLRSSPRPVLVCR